MPTTPLLDSSRITAPLSPTTPSVRAGQATEPVVRLEKVAKVYARRHGKVHALRDTTLDFMPGSFTAVMGASGSGKSTLLQCAAGLDAPSSGTVRIDGVDLAGLREAARTKFRRERVGFVFQAFNLLPSLTVAQNVGLPLRLAGRRADRRHVADVLARVGLAEHGRRRPAQLSGGEQQRVAIARALVTRPAVIFADEPTGALDPDTAADICGLLRATVDRDGHAVVLVTHDPAAAAWAERLVLLADGSVVETRAINGRRPFDQHHQR